MPRFSISYTDPVTNEVVLVERNFEADGGHPARYWAEDYAYTVADKGPYTVRELPMTNDVFGALDEPFESEQPSKPKKTPRGQQHKSGRPVDRVPETDFMNVLLPSTFTIQRTGEVVTEWLVVGRAFNTDKGWKIVLKENISVSGTLMVMPPRD